MQIDGIEVTCWLGAIDELASKPLNWSDGIPTSTKYAYYPEDSRDNECKWDIDDFTIPIWGIESLDFPITIASNCFLNGECFAPKSLVDYTLTLSLDRPPPDPETRGDGYIWVGDTRYKYDRFMEKWGELFPFGLQAAAINQWDNSDEDNVYSNDNNWSLGHKPAALEDIEIPDTSIIGKCVMDENSADALTNFDIDANGEFESGSFTIFLVGGIWSNAGTYTRGTGTVEFGAGGVVDVTSGGDPFYHVVVEGSGTIFYLKDDAEIFDLDVQAGNTLEIDAVSEAGALTLTYSDIANCGFLASAGTLLCQGSGANGVTITGDGAPPTNYWDLTCQNLTVTSDYTTFENYSLTARSMSTVNIDNCTFQLMAGAAYGLYLQGATITSFTNNTIDCAGATNTNGMGIIQSMIMSNITIQNLVGGGNALVINTSANPIECVDCSFDITKIFELSNLGWFISENHNLGGDYYIHVGTADTALKSNITNDFATGDTVILNQGTFTADEPSACLSFDVQSGTTLEIDAVTYGAGMSWTWDDVALCGFLASAGSLVCIGNGSFGLTVTSENTPPAVYWDASATSLNVTADYTTFEYFASFYMGTPDIDNCIFQNASSTAMVIGFSATSFDNNTINTAAAQSAYVLALNTSITITNLVITGVAAGSHIRVSTNNRIVEFVNSNFDISKVEASFTNWAVISKDHNDVGQDYQIVMRGKTLSKSSITNDFGATDNVTLDAQTTSKMVANEAIANNNFIIQSDAELEIDDSITWTVTDTGTVTVLSGGTLDITGSAGNLITIVSDTPGTQWTLDAQSGSTVTVSFVDVTDSDASEGGPIDATDGTSVNGGNNRNWLWPSVKGLIAHQVVGIEVVGIPIIFS